MGALSTKKGDLIINIGGTSSKESLTEEVTRVIRALAEMQKVYRQTGNS